ncbi:hypothetical protein T484DRAFT_1770148, partial [Baffinella frigidus]
MRAMTMHAEAGDAASAVRAVRAHAPAGAAQALAEQACFQALGRDLNAERAAAVVERLCGAEAAVTLALQRGAAAVVERLCGAEAAVTLALQRGVFSAALAVAVRAAPGQIPRVREAHGDALLRQGSAVALYAKAGCPEKAVGALALAGRWGDAEAKANRNPNLLLVIGAIRNPNLLLVIGEKRREMAARDEAAIHARDGG